jgi:hypothetical protein
MTFPGEMARGFTAAGLENIAEVTLTIRMDFAISTTIGFRSSTARAR